MYLVTFVYGGYLIAHGRMDVVDLSMYALYIGIFISPIQILVELMEMMQKGMSGFRRYLDVMETETDIKDAPDAQPLTDIQGNVSYKNVSFHYPDDDAPVLENVSFEIPAGRSIALVGPSGSGKSTLVRCFNRLNKPTSGSVCFNGRDLSKLSKKELLTFRRNNISMVFQSFGLMSHRDVLGNVAYGLEVKGVSKAEREKKAMEVISMVGLSGWEHQSCKNLSGGMRQRVGIARALANDPDVLLMDEPFSALDPLVRQDMQFELLQIQRKLKKTGIFITHDIDEAFKLGDTVAIMKDGKLVQVDTPEQMSEHPANEYVEAFINNADKSHVLCVHNIMITPKALIQTDDGPEHAIRVMNKNELSTVYVVDKDLRLAGVLTINAFGVIMMLWTPST